MKNIGDLHEEYYTSYDGKAMRLTDIVIKLSEIKDIGKKALFTQKNIRRKRLTLSNIYILVNNVRNLIEDSVFIDLVNENLK